MAKEFNLTDLLESKKSTIKIGSKTYEVNNSLKTIFALEDLVKSEDANNNRLFVEKYLAIAFGDKIAKEILAKDYPMKLYYALIDNVKLAIDEESVTDNDDKNP